MRFRWFLIGILLFPGAGIVGAAAQIQDHSRILAWRTYVGPRDGTTVDFPANIFLPSGNPAKGTGQRFKGMDGRAVLSIYSLQNEVGEGPAAYLKRNLRVRRSAIQYQRIAKSFFAISMERDDLIYYSRCSFVTHEAPSIHCFDLEYPQEDMRAWIPL